MSGLNAGVGSYNGANTKSGEISGSHFEQTKSVSKREGDDVAVFHPDPKAIPPKGKSTPINGPKKEVMEEAPKKGSGEAGGCGDCCDTWCCCCCSNGNGGGGGGCDCDCDCDGC